MNSFTCTQNNFLTGDSGSFIFTCSKNNEKKRKHPSVDLPDGSGWGDHIQLLQIFERWDDNNYNINWCKDNNLQVPFSLSTS